MCELLVLFLFIALCLACVGNLKQTAWADWAQDRIEDLERLNSALMEEVKNKEPPC